MILMMRRKVVAKGFVVAAALAAGTWGFCQEPKAEMPPPAFTKKPVATKAGDPSSGSASSPQAGSGQGKVHIQFAVSRETDVSVFIEDGNGKIVRHLVSGVLGKNPPAPLQANSLEQSVEWDGQADFGKPAGAGPFKVRVALGLAAKYDRQVIADPQPLYGVKAMAAGPDGTLYVVTGNSTSCANFSGQRLIALDRDGTYQRTVLPPPSTTTKEQFAALGGAAVEVSGRHVPVVMDIPHRSLTGISIASSSGMAVTPDGQLLALQVNGHMGMLDVANHKQPSAFQGPKLLPKEPGSTFDTYLRPYMAVSSDGTSAYFSGLAGRKSWSSPQERFPPYPAIFKVKLPERTGAVPFFGDKDKAGHDETHLGAAQWLPVYRPGVRGLATDGKGTLFICDGSNNRIVAVNEATGTFAGALAVESPEMVEVDRQTGALYVLRLLPKGMVELAKFTPATDSAGASREPQPNSSPQAGSGPAAWKDGKQVASVQFPAKREEPTWTMVLDAHAKPPVLWLTNSSNLLRVEDLGDKFGAAKPVGGSAVGDGGFVGLEVDRFREDPEVYARVSRPGWLRFNEKTGTTEPLQLRWTTSGDGTCILPGPDGNLYGAAWPQYLFKWDRNGKPLKWDAPYTFPPASSRPDNKNRTSNSIYVPVCMVFMTHTHGIRGDGHHFVFEKLPTVEDKAPKALYEYAPSGARIGGPLVWKVSDSAIGPKFDPQGNLYISEQVRPVDQLVPPEFASNAGPVVKQMYGSIIKFSPKGGMIDWPGSKPLFIASNPFKGQPKLDPSLKTVDMTSYVTAGMSSYIPAKVTGAEWVRMGISHMEISGCNCENTRFDVDWFGRVWYPDLGRFRVGVLDTNGNEITTFGGYGNAESCGPDSPVIDPKTGKVRPRLPEDPKDLKSPFAEPEIAFAWLIGVGATDRYAYMGDSLNRRLLRAKLVYAAEESCSIP